jgi:hypothetical protein
MQAKFYRDFGLAADAVGFSCLRKSLLMLANNFRVGTLFNSSRFCFASNGELL